MCVFDNFASNSDIRIQLRHTHTVVSSRWQSGDVNNNRTVRGERGKGGGGGGG